MAGLTPITPEQYSAKQWLRSPNYRFASQQAVAPIFGIELANAAATLPLVFVQSGEQFQLAALLSLRPNHNVFVAPDGRWLAPYIPAFFRAYPFSLVPRPGTDDFILCFDEASGLLAGSNQSGEAFFDAEGKLSSTVQQVFNMLGQVETSRRATQNAVNALKEAGLIQPLQMAVKTDQGNQQISGLFRVDEAALNALSDDQFLKLRSASALGLAYAQMLSTSHLAILDHLTKLQGAAAPAKPKTIPDNLDNFFGLSNDQTIKFN